MAIEWDKETKEFSESIEGKLTKETKPSETVQNRTESAPIETVSSRNGIVSPRKETVSGQNQEAQVQKEQPEASKLGIPKEAMMTFIRAASVLGSIDLSTTDELMVGVVEMSLQGVEEVIKRVRSGEYFEYRLTATKPEREERGPALGEPYARYRCPVSGCGKEWYYLKKSGKYLNGNRPSWRPRRVPGTTKVCTEDGHEEWLKITNHDANGNKEGR